MIMAPLGDDAVLASFDREADAAHFSRQISDANLPWVTDVVTAYFTVAVFLHPSQVTLAQAITALSKLGSCRPSRETSQDRRTHVIPVCYEMGPDLDAVVEHTGLSRDDVAAVHCGRVYDIFAIGFCPGFPYLGYLPSELEGVPRLANPRVRVEAGSVALTGKQTGIYPLQRPGGWSLIGRTPLQLVDLSDAYFPLRAGDRVQFERIDAKRFVELDGERLT